MAIKDDITGASFQETKDSNPIKFIFARSVHGNIIKSATEQWNSWVQTNRTVQDSDQSTKNQPVSSWILTGTYVCQESNRLANLSTYSIYHEIMALIFKQIQNDIRQINSKDMPFALKSKQYQQNIETKGNMCTHSTANSIYIYRYYEVHHLTHYVMSFTDCPHPVYALWLNLFDTNHPIYTLVLWCLGKYLKFESDKFSNKGICN